jgi:lysophospholipase L1-like esterase
VKTLRRLFAVFLGAALLVAAPARASVPAVPWSATWGTSQGLALSVGPWQAETLRMVARSSLAGTQVRVHLSNTFATSTAVFGHVSIGVQQNGPDTWGAPVELTFSGSASVALAPGASTVSDPTNLTVSANTRLIVSVYFPAGANIVSAPAHQLSQNVEYNYNGSDVTGSASPAPFTNEFPFTSYISGIDVGTTAASTVVAAGDSITDGTNDTVDADSRWPDFLAARVAPLGYGVVNAGIVADEVTADVSGAPSLTSRWLRDVLSVPGVRTVVDQGGINDLRNGVTAAQLESAQTTLIGQAHAAGVRVVLTTITPCAGQSLCTASFETQRQAYNSWVRGDGGGSDGYADFDAAVGGGSSGGLPALNPAYDSGDHIHPDPAGDELLAGSIPVGAL